MSLKALTSRVSATGVAVTLLLAAFIYVQWPTRVNTKMVSDYVVINQPELGFEIAFEAEPDHKTEAGSHVYILQRKGLSTMLQVSPLEHQTQQQWLEKSSAADLKSFGGKKVLEWNFKKSGLLIDEYAFQNQTGFINQVRITSHNGYVYKWVVGYKDKDDTELKARILNFMDSFKVI